MRSEGPLVSVIIPVYNGAARIGKTLESILNQDFPSVNFEVIIVNNNSTDNLLEVVGRFEAKFAGRLRCVLENKQGLCHTRNKGIEEARGEIVCFTDDDCVADSKWLSSIVRTFETTRAEGVLGKIVLATQIPEGTFYPEWFLEERFAHVNYGDQQLELKSQNMVGANMSYRKDVFKRYGKFDPNPIYALCDDSEFSMRATKQGLKKVYCPNAVIYHHYDISRIKDEKFFRQSFYWGRASIMLEPADISGLKYFIFRFRQLISQAGQLFVLKLQGDKLKVFLMKCKIAANWGRCFQLLQNGFEYTQKEI